MCSVILLRSVIRESLLDGGNRLPPPTNLLLLNARPCSSEAVQPDKGAVARADIVAALRRVDRKQ